MFGWITRKRQRRNGDLDAGRIARNAFETVAELGDLMRRYPAAILDASALPLPKPDMKIAIKVAWQTAGDEHLRNAAEIAYVHLCQFQDGVGAEPVDPLLPVNCDPDQAAAIRDLLLALSTRVLAEQRSLIAEWNEFKQ